MTRLWSLVRAATLADASVALGVVAIIAALVYPTLSARAFRAHVVEAVAAVDAVASAARTSRELQGRWPAAAEPGEPPPELSGLGASDGPFSHEDYALAWTTWEVVDSMEAPPDPGPPPAPGDAPRETDAPRAVPVTRAVGAVSVHSGDRYLLAELLAHYGSEASFVMDTSWVLVLPERSRTTAPPGP